MENVFEHKPIMLKECIENLKIISDGIYIDCTLGGGGHSSEIIKRLSGKGMLIGIDQDAEAIEVATKRLSGINEKARLIIEKSNFENLDNICEKINVESVNGILIDLGVSSYQLDTGDRGFSYNHDAKLDMRMDRKSETTAYEVLNTKSSEELTKILREYGEENWASRIAEFIIERRKVNKMETTFDLVDAIKSAIPASARKDGPHPAKRSFQALRIYINDELGVLERTIEKAVKLLQNDGRIAIISFHSLEDRIVKNSFQRLQDPCECPKSFPVCICNKVSSGKIVTRKPIIPENDEIADNPRARSAKLRVFNKTIHKTKSS
jgi:16S rRNA (cytosine1402-N4)-methyltransferase